MLACYDVFKVSVEESVLLLTRSSVKMLLVTKKFTKRLRFFWSANVSEQIYTWHPVI